MRSGSRNASIEPSSGGYRIRVMQRSDTVEGPALGPVDEATEEDLARRIGDLAMRKGVMVAAAESLTGGMIASALSASEGSSEWFLGSVVAYSREVKHDVLGVPPGPVVSAEAASAMARGVRKLFGSPVAISATGAGGPSGQDGREPGTVFLAFDSDDDHRVVRLQLEEAPPKAICATTTVAALRMLVEGLEEATSRDGDTLVGSEGER
jgi:nicotinamide-nucleotide amidase